MPYLVDTQELLGEITDGMTLLSCMVHPTFIETPLVMGRYILHLSEVRVPGYLLAVVAEETGFREVLNLVCCQRHLLLAKLLSLFQMGILSGSNICLLLTASVGLATWVAGCPCSPLFFPEHSFQNHVL